MTTKKKAAPKAEAPRKRTPSPKYMAAATLLEMVHPRHVVYPATEDLAHSFKTRVSPEKRRKVMEQHERITKKLIERLEKIVAAWEAGE